MKIDFSKTFPFAENYGFKFINQRTVVYKMSSSGFTYTLSKLDVIDAINYFISKLHSISDKSFKGDGMVYKVFKMHDLVPYLYTLINLYLTRRSSSIISYHRWLPELKLTRFCHLPFDEEVIVPVEIPEVEIECAYLHAEGSKSFQYVALLAAFHPIAYDSIHELRDKLQSLFPLKRIVLTIVGR